METPFKHLSIPIEQALSEQIYSALQGSAVEVIIKEAKYPVAGNYWRNMLEGHSFKVDDKIMGHLFKLFNDVKEKLGFEGRIDFYISGDASVNAFAIPSLEDDEPNIINFNSALIQLMTEDELKFVVGHEIGHLINNSSTLSRLINFVFPPETSIPIMLLHKIKLWQQLSELVADRYGFIAANEDLNSCISAFFKMSSGLDLKKVDMEIDAFIEENNKRLDFFRSGRGLNLASHPINPIRVQALNLFSRIEPFTDKESPKYLPDNKFAEATNELIDILLRIRKDPLDQQLSLFIASAGLLTASKDGEYSEYELEHIISQLSNFQIFPSQYLEEIGKSGQLEEIFRESAKNILEMAPGMREDLLECIINITMSDKEISPDEFRFVFQIGQEVFGYSTIEIAQIFSRIIQNNFVPSINAMS